MYFTFRMNEYEKKFGKDKSSCGAGRGGAGLVYIDRRGEQVMSFKFQKFEFSRQKWASLPLQPTI